MLSEAGADEIVVVFILKREEAAVNKSLMPSVGNGEELVLDLSVQRDEVVIKVSVKVTAGENASLQLVDDTRSTSDDAGSISFQPVFACSNLALFLKYFVVG